MNKIAETLPGLNNYLNCSFEDYVYNTIKNYLDKDNMLSNKKYYMHKFMLCNVMYDYLSTVDEELDIKKMLNNVEIMVSAELKEYMDLEEQHDEDKQYRQLNEYIDSREAPI